MIDQRVRMFFESARLKQYPPAERTVFVYNKTARFRFPWMTFGAIQWEWRQHEVPLNRGVYPLVYVHHRPWENLEDAMNILQLPGPGFHQEDGIGNFCPGDQTLAKISNGTMSVEDAFWFTTNAFDKSLIPETQANWDWHTSEMSTDLGSQFNKRLHRTIVNWFDRAMVLDRAMVMSDFAFVVVPLKSRSP